MACIYMTGFDSGTTSECAGIDNGAVLDGTTKRTGGYSLRVNTGTTRDAYFEALSAAGGWTTANVATSYITVYIRIATLPASGSEQVMDIEGSAKKCFVRVTSTGTLQLYAADGTTQIGSDSSALSTDTWYRLDWTVPTGASVTPSLAIYTDAGAQVGSTVTGTGDCHASNAQYLTLGRSTNRNSQTTDIYYDDLWWDNAALVGAHAIVCGAPTANGSTMTMTGGTGASDYTQVNTIPPDEAKYVAGVGDDADVGLFGFASAATLGVSGTIHAVKAYIRGYEGTAESSASVRIHSGASDLDTAAYNFGAAWVSTQEIAETDPATSAAWTTGGIDGVEAGMVEAATGVMQCCSVLLMVSYTASGTSIPVFAHHYRQQGIQ